MDKGYCRRARIGQDRHEQPIRTRCQHRDKVDRRPLVIRHDGQIRYAMALAQRRRFLGAHHTGAMIGHCCSRSWHRSHGANRRRHDRLLEQQTERGQQGEYDAHVGMLPALVISGGDCRKTIRKGGRDEWQGSGEREERIALEAVSDENSPRGRFSLCGFSRSALSADIAAAHHFLTAAGQESAPDAKSGHNARLPIVYGSSLSFLRRPITRSPGNPHVY